MQSVHLQETAVRYFLEVVRSGSISEAAVRLFVSGSAVSRQIAGLESVLGVALFERRPRGMVPSAAGELLAAYARRATLEADRVVSDIEALQGLRKGKVRIASSAGFVLEFLPQVMVDFQRRYPGIQFQLQVARPADVTTAILNGDADIGLTYSRAAEQGICVEYRQEAPVLVIMRPDHPLAKFRAVTLAQMQPYPLALPDRENTVRQLFDICCSRRQLVFEPALVSVSFEALTSFVLHGGGLSISGEVTVRHRMQRGELHGAMIRDRGMDGRVIEVQTLTGRTLPEGARTFLEVLKRQLPAPAGDGQLPRAGVQGRRGDQTGRPKKG
ncbi:LysR family transcriptional regulator [Polaromonas jejuensis]|uniref:LysR family transcriptional regulator n=1 Tax=Polaromonas jejuensis TaxID=457502 RepID=A0ABW0QBM7_9BURK|nr:LysR family transcriptional regulator [Polaromonas jejuensis]